MKQLIDYKNISSIQKLTKDKKVVLVGGCFDILHPGHLAFLDAAKQLGDILVLVLESDKSVKDKKGDSRPINNLKDRSQNLFNKSPVNIIVNLPYPFYDLDYDNLVMTIKPAIIATTNGDPHISHKKRQAVIADAQLIKVIERVGGYSTTSILNQYD